MARNGRQGRPPRQSIVIVMSNQAARQALFGQRAASPFLVANRDCGAQKLRRTYGSPDWNCGHPRDIGGYSLA